MASLLFNSLAHDMATGAVNFGSDTFYGMLVTASYSPNKDTHTKRSDVTNEVVGTGYVAGGQEVAVSVGAVDTGNDRVQIAIADGGVVWPAAFITARAMVVYKYRGGASSADELVGYIDFGADFTSTAGDFSVGESTLTLQN